MIRFTIRDVLWLTVVVALAIAWWIDRRSLRSALTATQVQLAEVEADRAEWEERTQLGAATHLKMLRVINDQGLMFVTDGNGKTSLQPYRDPTETGILFGHGQAER